jgi:hypothetical protein
VNTWKTVERPYPEVADEQVEVQLVEGNMNLIKFFPITQDSIRIVHFERFISTLKQAENSIELNANKSITAKVPITSARDF